MLYCLSQPSQANHTQHEVTGIGYFALFPLADNTCVFGRLNTTADTNPENLDFPSWRKQLLHEAVPTTVAYTRPRTLHAHTHALIALNHGFNRALL